MKRKKSSDANPSSSKRFPRPPFGPVAAVFFLLVFSFGSLKAEVVYLKDGQVLNGAIVDETDKTITFKTKYKTSKLNRSDILRILYGERKLEKIFMQLKDERIIEAYMVDQDNEKVTIRLDEKNPKEDFILKSDIAQMSNERILPLQPALSLRTGYYIPLNTKSGADLDPGLMYLAGFGIKLFFFPNSRILFEAGYAKNIHDFKDVDGKTRQLSLQTIPLLFTYNYLWNLERFRSKPEAAAKSGAMTDSGSLLSRFNLLLRGGAGASFLTFDDAEGQKLSGIKLTALAGTGISYEVLSRRLFVQFITDFLYTQDTGASLQSLLVSFNLEYRY